MFSRFWYIIIKEFPIYTAHFNNRGEKTMADKNIKKEVKKKKKADIKVPVLSTYERPVVTQPEIIKKKKKER